MFEFFCNFFPKKEENLSFWKNVVTFHAILLVVLLHHHPITFASKHFVLLAPQLFGFKNSIIIILARILIYGSLHYLTLNISFIHNLPPFLSKFLFQVPCTQHEFFHTSIGPNDLVNGWCDSSFPFSKITKSFD